MNLPEPKLEWVTDLTVELDPIRSMGHGRAGNRRIIPIVGGTMDGPKLQGTVLNVGADWQTVFADGLAELDTRYALETHDGATIEIVNYGFRHGSKEALEAIARGEDVSPDSYYMRTHARLETGDSPLGPGPLLLGRHRFVITFSGTRSRATIVLGSYRNRWLANGPQTQGLH